MSTTATDAHGGEVDVTVHVREGILAKLEVRDGHGGAGLALPDPDALRIRG